MKVQNLTQDTLSVSQQFFPVGTNGTISIRDVGDVKTTVISVSGGATRLRLQTTEAQKKALILRFYTQDGRPGVASVKLGGGGAGGYRKTPVR